MKLILIVAALLGLAACDPTTQISSGPGPSNIPYLCGPTLTGGFACIPNPGYKR